MRIFHYTSVDTLEHILKDRTLMFNNLTNLDDPLEDIQGSINWSRVTYASCWMNDSTESISMWNMYSNDLSGIRLEIDTDNLQFESVEDNSVVEIKGCDNQILDNSLMIEGYTRLELDRIGMSTVYKSPELVEVEYVKNKTLELLESGIIRTTEEGENKQKFINTGIFGRYKLTPWRFQKEWRYIISLNPYTLQEIHDFNIEVMEHYREKNQLKSISEFINNKIKGNKNIPKHLLIKLKDETFTDARITLGPCISHSDKNKVRVIRDKYFPSIKIEESNIRIKCKSK